MKCVKPLFLYQRDIFVPCGTCQPCLKYRRSLWVMRCQHELSTSGHTGIFLTLTYDNDHLPSSGSLVKNDSRLFLKRFRRKFGSLKFFGCGEYGDRFQRPHFHYCFFGRPLFDFSFRPYSRNSLRLHYTSDSISGIWSFGFNDIGDLTVKSLSYVAGYVQKKLFRKQGKNFYGDRVPPYLMCSKGIGKDYALSHKDSIIVDFTVNGRSLPRYYRKIFGIDTVSDQRYVSFIRESMMKSFENYRLRTGVDPFTSDLGERYFYVNKDNSLSFPTFEGSYYSQFYMRSVLASNRLADSEYRLLNRSGSL